MIYYFILVFLGYARIQTNASVLILRTHYIQILLSAADILRCDHQTCRTRCDWRRRRRRRTAMMRISCSNMRAAGCGVSYTHFMVVLLRY